MQIGTNKLTVEIDGAEHAPDVSTVEIVSEESDSDFVSFEMARQGGSRDWILHMVLAQDAATGSLWSMIFDQPGAEVDVTVRPYGNETASATEPHFTGTCVVSPPDGGPLLGGEADPSTSNRFTTEVEWKFLQKPTRVTS